MLNKPEDLREALKNIDSPGLATPQHNYDASEGVSTSLVNESVNEGGTRVDVNMGASASVGADADNSENGKGQVDCIEETTPIGEGHLDSGCFIIEPDFESDTGFDETHVENGTETTNVWAL